MYKDGKVWLAVNEDGEDIFLLPGKANRHGLIAGATGTGKTVTLRVMAEAFSDMGVPVFLADVKGDIAGMMAPGIDSEDRRGSSVSDSRRTASLIRDIPLPSGISTGRTAYSCGRRSRKWVPCSWPAS